MKLSKAQNKKDIFFINLIYFLIILLPLTLITGPFIPDLSITIICFSFIYLSIKNSLISYYKSRFSKIFFVIYLLLNLTSIFSVDMITSLKITFVYFRYFIFSLAFWYLIKIRPDVLKSILKVIIISMSVLILDGFYQFYNGENILGWKLIDTRISSFFKDELILGSYLSRMFPIFFALCILNFDFFSNKKIYKILIFFLLSSIEVLTFLSGERVAFFYINLSAIFLMIMMKNYKALRFLSLTFALIIIFIITNINSVYKERIVDQTIKQLGSKDQKYIFSMEHTNHYLSAYKMFLDHKISGIGPRMFRANCHLEEYKITFESCTTHPHNIYVQIFAESGLIGVIILLIPLVALIYFSIKHFILKYLLKKFIHRLPISSVVLFSNNSLANCSNR